MHCFSGVEGFSILGDQAVSQLNPLASLKIIGLQRSEAAPIAQRCLAAPVKLMWFVFQFF